MLAGLSRCDRDRGPISCGWPSESPPVILSLILVRENLSVVADKHYICYVYIADQSCPVPLSRFDNRCAQSFASALQTTIVRLRLAAPSLKITSFLRFHSCQQQRATKVLKCLPEMCGGQIKVSKDPATAVVSVGMLIPSLDQKSSAKRHPATMWLAVSFSC